MEKSCNWVNVLASVNLIEYVTISYLKNNTSIQWLKTHTNKKQELS